MKQVEMDGKVFLSKELIINAKNPYINVYFINIKQVEQYVYHMKTINNHNRYTKK
jgi:hypothetical protein